MTPGRASGGWRGLGVFWVCVLSVLIAGGVTLQVLGPPEQHQAASGSSRTPVAAQRPVAPAPPGRTSPGPMAPPDATLLEPPLIDGPGGAGLPRIGPDGRTPMHAYAAWSDPTIRVPRIAIIIAGVGLDEAASEDAIRALPAPVTLAISPYATTPDAVAAAARQAGHEYLISLPLEPQGYAQNDPGRHALLTSASLIDNLKQLNWVLSRVAGYVGATGALGDMRGERFAEMQDQMEPMLATLAARGLLYVDPRPGAARLPSVWSRTVDVVIDDPPSAAAIDARLADLEKRAHDTGAAVGLIGAVRPVTIQHLLAWAGNLGGRGYALAPVSALVNAPDGTMPRRPAAQAVPAPTAALPAAVPQVTPPPVVTPPAAVPPPAAPRPAPPQPAAAAPAARPMGGTLGSAAPAKPSTMRPPAAIAADGPPSDDTAR